MRESESELKYSTPAVGDRVRVVATVEALANSGICLPVATLLPGTTGIVMGSPKGSYNDWCRVKFDGGPFPDERDEYLFPAKGLRILPPVTVPPPAQFLFKLGDMVTVFDGPWKNDGVWKIEALVSDGAYITQGNGRRTVKAKHLMLYPAKPLAKGDMVTVAGEHGFWQIEGLVAGHAFLRRGGHTTCTSLEDLTLAAEAPSPVQFKAGDSVYVSGQSGVWEVKHVSSNGAYVALGERRLKVHFDRLTLVAGTRGGHLFSVPQHVEVTTRMATAQDLMHQIISIGQQCRMLGGVASSAINGLRFACDGLKQIMADEIESQTKK